ncbi:MAG TPA: sulfite exporter TauE/SafE family protein [Methylocystis sp.]|nr:sulfite exporter TauE/SafE family protein [Methylocystis sp.]
MDLIAALSGVGVGVVQGLIGGGGSVLGVPALIYVVGLSDPHLAIGTSALAAGLSALVSLAAYARSRHVKWGCGLAFTTTGALGALAGSSLGMAFPGERLVALFGALMIFIALVMALGRPIGGDPHVRLDLRSASRLAPFLLAYGAGVGCLSGFFGIGGGFLAVPGLLAATDMPLIFAIGTSLISVSVFGLTTAANYAFAGLIDWRVAAFFLAGGALGGVAGARLARLLAAKRGALARVFSVIVALVGVFLIAKTIF